MAKTWNAGGQDAVVMEGEVKEALQAAAKTFIATVSKTIRQDMTGSEEWLIRQGIASLSTQMLIKELLIAAKGEGPVSADLVKAMFDTIGGVGTGLVMGFELHSQSAGDQRATSFVVNTLNAAMEHGITVGAQFVKPPGRADA